MGQFKPMPKMKTTEPSVELKLKKGGRVKMAEGGKSDMSQDKAMIKKAMKQHDAQEHKGGKGTTLKLRRGGMSAPKAGPDVMGGLAGGIEATRPVMKKGTGKIEGPGYKKGGKTGGIEGKGYKSGGHVAMSSKGVDGFKTGGKMCKY